MCVLQRQISQLLLSSSGGGHDDEYVAKLRQQLNQAHQEIRTLLETRGPQVGVTM